MGTTFQNCSVCYSLFGINSLTEYVTLAQCRFSQNGKSDFTVNGVKVDAAVQPFSYAYAHPQKNAEGDDFGGTAAAPKFSGPYHPAYGLQSYRAGRPGGKRP